jgi:hypothetical protein
MFKFGDKVIEVDDEFNFGEGVVQAVDAEYNMMTVMFDKKPKQNQIFFNEYLWDNGRQKTYAIKTLAKFFKKVEPINNCNSDAKNTADQIAKLIDTDKPIDERIIDFCEKYNQQHTQDKLSAVCSNVLHYYKSIDDKEQKTEIQPAEPLKEVTLNLTNKSFKKHKPNKLRKLIKKIVKTELKKIFKFKNKVEYIYKTEGIKNE